jgi:hypothetical protein
MCYNLITEVIIMGSHASLLVQTLHSILCFRTTARDKSGREIYNELCVDGQERPQAAVQEFGCTH